MTDARRSLIHSRRCSSVCSQVLVHRIVSARRVVAVAASFLVAACADRTRGASVPGTGSGTEFVGPSVPRRRSARGRDHGADGRSAGCERGHPQGGRGAGRARRAAVERGDRGPDVRVGAHRRDPRVVAAAQAAARATVASSDGWRGGPATTSMVDGGTIGPVRNGHVPVHRCRGLDRVVGPAPVVHAGGAGAPRRRGAGRDRRVTGATSSRPRATGSVPRSPRPRRLSLLRLMPSGHWGRSRGRAMWPFECGWDCTAARRRSETATTSEAPSTVPPASPRSGAGARSCCRRRLLTSLPTRGGRWWISACIV